MSRCQINFEAGRAVSKSGRVPTLIMGLVFCCIGISILKSIFVISGSASNQQSFIITAIFLGIFGFIFLCLGLVLVNGPEVIIVDAQKRQVIQRYGHLISLKKKVTPLDDIGGIVLRKQRWHSGPKRTYYPICLEKKSGQGEIAFCLSLKNYLQAKEAAQKLATHFGLIFRDEVRQS